MHPYIEVIKKECWDGEDRLPNPSSFNIPEDSMIMSAEGVQYQIDCTDANIVMVFVLDKHGKLQKFVVQKEPKNEN